MSRSDEILNRLIALTRNNGGFVATWKRTGFDKFTFTVTGHTFSAVWANEVLQAVHPGADIDQLYPVQRKVTKPVAAEVVKLAPPEPRPAAPLTAGQHRSISEAEAADTHRRRRR